ncbi:MAG: hypothetical protein JO092_01155 [Candidatus Eremiobacteraeota bacterium]|nr:hypothetical protein [Candidatus Eremiobacteraeota bacterium]
MSKEDKMQSTASLVTHREFKLLFKPEKFPNRRAVLEFNQLLARNAKALDVEYEPVESLDSQLRIVQFYDTKGEVLRKNKLIFRIRQIRQGGWPDDSWELTFKCRTPEYEQAAAFNTDTTLTKLQKKKFKEELIRGDSPGTMKSIFSNNVIVEYPDISVETDFPLSRLADHLPHLKTLGLNPDDTLSIVAGAKVFELQCTLGTLNFGHGVTANATLAVWARPIPDRFEPLIAEFGFSTHVQDGDKKGEKGQAVADEFFKSLQVPLKDYLADGTTKTALIYGDEAS